MPLPNNLKRKSPGSFGRPNNVTTGGPAPEATFEVVVIAASQTPSGTLVYNKSAAGTIDDADALLYVLASDLDWQKVGVPTKPNGSPDWTKVTPAILRKVTLKDTVPVEPLVLRVCAGDFITVTLYNALDPNASVFQKSNGVAPSPPFGTTASPAAGTLPNLTINPSADVGLHPQLLTFDMSVSNGINAGWNEITTVAPANLKLPTVSGRAYQWYAGNIQWDQSTGQALGQPAEFGAVNLVAADPLVQHRHSLVAAMVVEPEGTSWSYDKDSSGNVITRTSVNVSDKSNATLFREFVLLTQDDLLLSQVTSSGFNFGTEPFRFRGARSMNVAKAVSDQQVNPPADPQTPVFAVNAGTPVRWRLLHPGGLGNADVFTIDGHVWREEPYRAGSTEIGQDIFSQWMGSRASLMPNNAYDVVLERAGGRSDASGDFLYRGYDSPSYTSGWWGIMRVTQPKKDGIVITSAVLDATNNLEVTGSTVVNASASRLANAVTIDVVDGPNVKNIPGQVTASVSRGEWNWTFKSDNPIPLADLSDKQIRATSAGGGDFTAPSRRPPSCSRLARCRPCARGPSRGQDGSRVDTDGNQGRPYAQVP